MKYLNELWKLWKREAGIKNEEDVASIFEMTHGSWRAQKSKLMDKRKKTIILAWQKTAFVPEFDICPNCKELIPDEQQIEKEEAVFYCPLCGEKIKNYSEEI